MNEGMKEGKELTESMKWDVVDGKELNPPQPSEMLLKQTDFYKLSSLVQKIRMSDAQTGLTF